MKKPYLHIKLGKPEDIEIDLETEVGCWDLFKRLLIKNIYISQTAGSPPAVVLETILGKADINVKGTLEILGKDFVIKTQK